MNEEIQADIIIRNDVIAAWWKKMFRNAARFKIKMITKSSYHPNSVHWFIYVYGQKWSLKFLGHIWLD